MSPAHMLGKRTSCIHTGRGNISTVWNGMSRSRCNPAVKRDLVLRRKGGSGFLKDEYSGQLKWRQSFSPSVDVTSA